MTRRIISFSDIQGLRTKQQQQEQSATDELELLTGSVTGTGPERAGAPPSAVSNVPVGADSSDAVAGKADDYATKLLKLIPAEVVAVFLTVDGIIHAADNVPRGVYWGIFVLLAVATYFYIERSTRTPDLPARPGQSILSAISFCVWVFAIGGPFTYPERPHWDLPVYGALLLPVYTFILPIFFRKF